MKIIAQTSLNKTVRIDTHKKNEHMFEAEGENDDDSRVAARILEMRHICLQGFRLQKCPSKSLNIQ